MTDRIAATEGALRAGAEAVHTAHDDVSAVVTRIQGELDDLAGLWKGPAALQYQQMFERWQNDTVRLIRSLDGLEEALRATDRDQNATEQSHQQTISSLSSLMGGN